MMIKCLKNNEAKIHCPIPLNKQRAKKIGIKSKVLKLLIISQKD